MNEEQARLALLRAIYSEDDIEKVVYKHFYNTESWPYLVNSEVNTQNESISYN